MVRGPFPAHPLQLPPLPLHGQQHLVVPVVAGFDGGIRRARRPRPGPSPQRRRRGSGRGRRRWRQAWRCRAAPRPAHWVRPPSRRRRRRRVRPAADCGRGRRPTAACPPRNPSPPAPRGFAASPGRAPRRCASRAGRGCRNRYRARGRRSPPAPQVPPAASDCRESPAARAGARQTRRPPRRAVRRYGQRSPGGAPIRARRRRDASGSDDRAAPRSPIGRPR